MGQSVVDEDRHHQIPVQLLIMAAEAVYLMSFEKDKMVEQRIEVHRFRPTTITIQSVIDHHRIYRRRSPLIHSLIPIDLHMGQRV